MSYRLISKTNPVSRKEYNCVWCNEKIIIGEKHIKEVGDYQGDFQSNRWHEECHNTVQLYFSESGEDCFEAGENERGSQDEKSIVSKRNTKGICIMCGEHEQATGLAICATCNNKASNSDVENNKCEPCKGTGYELGTGWTAACKKCSGSGTTVSENTSNCPCVKSITPCNYACPCANPATSGVCERCHNTGKINMKKEIKLKYINSTPTQVKWGSNDDPDKYLKKGNVYTLEREEVHSWHTKYYLKEFPDKKFNSVSFEIIEDKPEAIGDTTNMKFELMGLETQNYKKWTATHNNHCKSNSYSVKFTPTGIGMSITVICDTCGTTENITDYSTW